MKLINIFVLLFALILEGIVYASCPSQCTILGDNFLAQAAGCLSTEAPFSATTSSITSSPVGKTSEYMYEKLNAIAFGHSTVLSTDLRYENINIDQPGDNIEANIFGGTFDFSFSSSDSTNNTFTLGLYLPYDYFNYDNSVVKHIHQVGSILYGIYSLPVFNREYQMEFMSHISYYHDFIDLSDSHRYECFIDDDIDYLGFGFGFGLNKISGVIKPGFFSSVQYSHSYGELTNDYYLIRTGANIEINLTENWYISLFGSWIVDLTDYDPPRDLAYYDDDMFDNDNFWKIGVETGYSFGAGWELNVGYRKILGLRDFDSDKIYLGMLWKF